MSHTNVYVSDNAKQFLMIDRIDAPMVLAGTTSKSVISQCKEDFVFFVRTYRRYVLYKHKTSSYAYFFQRKKYIKKESFPFFLW